MPDTSEVLQRVDEIGQARATYTLDSDIIEITVGDYLFLRDSLRTALKDTEQLDWLLSQLRTWPGPAASLHVEAWLGGVSGAAQRRLTRKDLERAIAAESPTTGTKDE